jgi:hypothetical protein
MQYGAITNAYKNVSYNISFILEINGVRFWTGFNWLRKTFLAWLL